MYEFSLTTDLPFHQVYPLHQRVMAVMCGNQHRADKTHLRPLWRSYPYPQGEKEGSILLIRSTQKPLAALSNSSAANTKAANSKEIIGPIETSTFTLTEGEQRTFHCRLDLTKRVSEPGENRSSRKAIEYALPEAETEAWLTRLLHRHGFELQQLDLVEPLRVRLNRRHLINGADVVFQAKVHNATAAQQAYNQGLGRKKAFGFGLLLEAVR
ncbi:type I-E CRISPR-associated protein Cas6/Cse3/CasE [Endozoicomonas sp.]|uniref:type I-E CRISPR-associated protein Cas6/Cse3/CasE n=1 Tax=Endozoicomonas sp. TaxID=1892382 RepID=UPI003AF57379